MAYCRSFIKYMHMCIFKEKPVCTYNGSGSPGISTCSMLYEMLASKTSIPEKYLYLKTANALAAVKRPNCTYFSHSTNTSNNCGLSQVTWFLFWWSLFHCSGISGHQQAFLQYVLKCMWQFLKQKTTKMRN